MSGTQSTISSPSRVQHDAEGPVRRGVVGAQVQEHEVRVRGAAAHAPFLGHEAQRLLLQVLLGRVERERVELGGARRVVLAQRVAGPGARHHDALQVGVAAEADAVEVPHLALVPVGVRPDPGDRRQRQVIARQRHLDAHVAVALQRQQVIEDREIRGRKALAMRAQPLVHAMQVVEHGVGARGVAQEAQHLGQLRARHPRRRQAVHGRLVDDRVGAEAAVELGDDAVLAAGQVLLRAGSVFLHP
jgi:hypothetical protein